MTLLPFLAGLAVGALAGVGIGYLWMRSIKGDAETIAENISAKIVTQQTEQILRLAESKLGGKKDLIDASLKNMKDGMKTDLDRVEALMKNIGDKNVNVETRLTDAAKVIQDLNVTTGNLKNALSSNSGRGQWGERMAEDVLRLSGLIEGVNYIKQKKLEAGSKPDFTFMLPQDLKLNMDVKFPFNNYQLFVEAKSDNEREDFKKKFLKDVKDRVKEIQTRDYINPEDHTVDYVLLFVPNEQIFSFINEMDRTLIDTAMQAKTIICSPMSLYAILAVIRQSIDNFALEGKSNEMLSLLGAFKQQWEKFRESMHTVKTRLESVQKEYEELTGVRERQLDRQLTKLDEMRTERAIEPAIEEAFEKVTRKQMARTTTEVR